MIPDDQVVGIRATLATSSAAQVPSPTIKVSREDEGAPAWQVPTAGGHQARCRQM